MTPPKTTAGLVEFLRQVCVAQAEHPEWRPGQAAFNVLHRMAPALADEVSGTEFDPFNDDARSLPFLRWVARRFREDQP